MDAAFENYIGIDYSGAETPSTPLRGLRIYVATQLNAAQEIGPPPPQKYWTRRGIAEWLLTTLSSKTRTLVGIDHGFSFPLKYFERHGLPLDWPFFLDDFQKHWPTDDEHTYVDFVREGICGNGAARSGDSRWRRLRNCGRVRRSLSSTLMSQDKLRNPPTQVSHGSDIFGALSTIQFISGHSKGGLRHQIRSSVPKSTLPYGAERSLLQAERKINTTHLPPQSGYDERMPKAI